MSLGPSCLPRHSVSLLGSPVCCLNWPILPTLQLVRILIGFKLWDIILILTAPPSTTTTPAPYIHFWSLAVPRF